MVKEPTDSDPTEVFYITREQYRAWYPEDIFRVVNALRIGGFLEMLPCGADAFYLYSTRGAEGKTPTVTISHVRLPKLSYLITLSPNDFFLLLRLIATARNTQTGDSLSLNPAACGITDLASTTIAPYFTKMRVNYRMNDDYCDRKWTPREAIAFLSRLEPSRDSQLSAMQYLTVLQNDDILYFPIESMIDLELEWEQVSEEYCIPPENLSPKQ